MSKRWIQSATVEVNEQTGALLTQQAGGFLLGDGSTPPKVSPLTFSANTTLTWPVDAVALNLFVKSGAVQLQQTINGGPATVTLPSGQWIGIPGAGGDVTTLVPTGASVVEFSFELAARSAS